MNSFGTRLRLTTFGESHGRAIGGIIDGFPSSFRVDFVALNRAMAERRPGGPGASQRKEEDMPEFLSGINNEGITLGTPIGFVIRNKDTRSGDYDLLKDHFRPNHADVTYELKYGIRDHRGGGRASARETACRVVAGALATQWLEERGVRITTFLSSVGETETANVREALAHDVELAISRGTYPGNLRLLLEEIEKVRKEGDSVGGTVTTVVTGLPAGVGEPLYDKLSARLASAMMSINASKGFEIGDGFEMARARGSEVLDNFKEIAENKITTASNHNGGVLGGISTGMPLWFRVAFKPTPTIGKPVDLIDRDGHIETLTVTGRHDPCVALRGAAVVKAMTALTLMDLML